MIPVPHDTVKSVVLYHAGNVWLIVGPEESGFFVTNNISLTLFKVNFTIMD